MGCIGPKLLSTCYSSVWFKLPFKLKDPGVSILKGFLSSSCAYTLKLAKNEV